MQSLRDWLPFSLLNVQTSAPLWGTTHKGYCRPSLRDEKGQILTRHWTRMSALLSHDCTRWRTRMCALVRLRAHLNRRVKVPDLAITLGPVTESNCAGAIPPGGKQLELNEQSVTRLDTQRQVNSIRSAVLASLQAQRRSPNEIVRPALREWIASGREPQMVGDGMFGSSSDVNQGTTAGGERASRGQSPRSSEEAGNDRGAKGDRGVVLDDVGIPSHKGPSSAARLCAWLPRNIGAWDTTAN